MTDLFAYFFDAAVYNATGLLFIVLGVYVLIRVSGFPDLTVDGSFTVGAAVFASTLAIGWPYYLSLLATVLAGAVGGLLTWGINTVLGVGKVISGVLSMIILILLAPYLTGGSTQSLLLVQGLFSEMEQLDASLSRELLPNAPFQLHIVFNIMLLLVFGAIVAMIFWLLRSKLGLRARYVGSAASAVLVSRRSRRVFLAAGLAAGNALVAIGGAIEAQRRGGFTVNMGTGIILVGLATLILGESLVKSFRRRDYLYLGETAFALFAGVLVYSSGIQLILLAGVPLVDLRLLTALFFAFTTCLRWLFPFEFGASFLMKRLVASDLWFAYPTGEKWVIKGMTFSLRAGETVRVVGRNGSGKSTLLKIVSGQLEPTKGNIQVHGDAPAVYMAQDAGGMLAWDMTLREHMEAFYSADVQRGDIPGRNNRNDGLIKLARFRLDLLNQLDQFIGHLSGGQRQIAALMATLGSGAQVLCLDEFTSALDPISSEAASEILETAVREMSLSVLLVSHNEPQINIDRTVSI